MYGSTTSEPEHEMTTSTASRAGRFSTRNSSHYWIGYCIDPRAGVVTLQRKTIFVPAGNHIQILRSPNPASRNRLKFVARMTKNT